jgi:hypothetical protein
MVSLLVEALANGGGAPSASALRRALASRAIVTPLDRRCG